MDIRFRRMYQTATYWPPGSDDGLGGITFGTPSVLSVRWQDKVDFVRDAEGNEIVSSATVYVSETVEPGGWLALGDQSATADPRPIARKIINVGQSPNLRADMVLYKVWL